jgi:hypothetical protein
MSYPERYIRGISDHQYIVGNGIVGSGLFQFQDRGTRNDGWIDESINWEDDEDVIAFSLSQRKDTGEVQFKAGVAVLLREELDRLSRSPAAIGNLCYERQPLVGVNPYHGNILLRAEVPRNVRRMIAATLAIYATVVLRDQD